MRQTDTRGSMPFAVIAVAILLASGALAAAAYRHGTADDAADGIGDDIDSADDALADITVHVNRGLGNIIRGLSTASDGAGESDTLEERAETFDAKSAAWIEGQFPIASGGAVAHLVSHDVDLTAEAMQLSSPINDGGYTPTYLRGVGTIEVTLETGSGRGAATITVSTDGSYALPLVAERGSLFESMAGDGGVSVSEMVSYQLTGLAQYRVMNGYGSASAYGDRGTSAIITADDVRQAYSNALDTIAMICFRDEGNRFATEGEVDLSDLLVSDDGVIELDLAAVYAQALTAVIDDIALRWFDYFCGFEVLDALDRVLNPLRNAISSLVAFLLGEESVYSAVPYVEDSMGLWGIPQSEYRYPGSGTTTVTAAGITVTVENPTFDIHSATWLRDFGKRYEQDTNFVMDLIHDVLRGAALAVSERGDLGTVSVEIDPYDPEPFAQTLSDLFDTALEDCELAIESSISFSLGSAKVYDPYLGAIADEILAHSEEMVLSSDLERRIREAYAAAIPEDSDVTPDALTRDVVDRAVHSYRAGVLSDLEVFDRMRQIEDGGSIVKTVLTQICAFGLGIIGVLAPVKEAATMMFDEVSASIGMNPRGGVTELPGSSGFEMDDGEGGITYERIAAEISSEPAVTVAIAEERCTHTVGFRESMGASYSTTFRIGLDDILDLRLTGTGTFSGAMGTTSSVMSDSVSLDTNIEVTVLSGWPLAGVQYEQSVTFIDDLKVALLKIIEPLIEPLRKVMEIIRGVVTSISDALIEALTFVSEQLVRIYELITDPLAQLKRWLEDVLESVLTETVFGVLINLGEQTLTVEFLGCTLEISTDVMTWASNTKTLFSASMTIPVAGLIVSAEVTARVRGDMKAENLIVTGGGGVEGDGWSVDVSLDPLMKSRKYLITVDGEVGDTDISLIAPKLENYHEMGIALSDVPGLGDVVSNIPVGGANIGLDAGFSLKYADPQDFGLIVNEFETNPPGTDSGNEWVELYNNSVSTIDLKGYTLLAASDRRTKVMELSGSISPGEFLVIEPDFTLVNSSGKYTKNGEAVILKDPDGNEIDRTPTEKDGDNDSKTWQRSFDGSTEWVFAEATQGRTNDAFPGAKWVSAAELKDTVWSAVERSFDRIGSITDLESLQEFLQHLVRYTLEGLIGVVSGKIAEASVFVSVDVKDPTSSVSTGARVALRTDGDLVEDVLRYIVGKVMELVLKADNPYSIDPVGMFTDNIDLEVTVHAGVGFPEILSNGADLPDMDLGVTFRTNVSALSRILGSDMGRPEVEFGIRIIDCPEVAIPARLSPKEGMEHDLWLMMLTVRFA